MEQLLIKAKSDHNFLKELKYLCINYYLYEAAADLRGIEKELFEPESWELEEAQHVRNGLALCGLNVNVEACILLINFFERFGKVGKDFSLKDAMEIKRKKN